MTITKCDRCGTEIKLVSMIQLFTDKSNLNAYQEFELCGGCYDLIKATITKPPKKETSND